MAVDVVAALVVEDGKFMICQRPAYKARGLLWEFVGGKVEPSETRTEALVRECREELGVAVAPGPIYMEVDHVYPDITIHLTLFRASIVAGRPQKLEHADIRFIAPSDIPLYAFCPADASILKRITDRGIE